MQGIPSWVGQARLEWDCDGLNGASMEDFILDNAIIEDTFMDGVA